MIDNDPTLDILSHAILLLNNYRNLISDSGDQIVIDEVSGVIARLGQLRKDYVNTARSFGFVADAITSLFRPAPTTRRRRHSRKSLPAGQQTTEG